jgi:hypothetical protein
VLIVEPDGKSRFTTIPEARAEDNVTDVQLTSPSARAEEREVKGESRARQRRTRVPEERPVVRDRRRPRAGLVTDLPGLSVDKVSISDPTRLDQDVSLDYTLSIPRYAEAGVAPCASSFGSRRGYPRPMPAGRAARRSGARGPSVHRFTFRYRPLRLERDNLPPDVSSQTPSGASP